MKITYEIEDGYVGLSRPHTILIDDHELAECENEGQVEELIELYVKEHMGQQIRPHWKNPTMKEIEELRKEIGYGE